MKKTLLSAAALLFLSSPVFAQAASDTATVTVSAAVNAKAKLTLGANTVSFPDADPTATPSIVATALTVDVKARTSSAGSVTLTVLSGGDFVSGSDSIGIANLTWTASGSGMAAGTMSKTTAQALGTWAGSGNHTGMTQTYALANSWTYATGAYSASITYTLTAP
jgi:hypothetical protein